MSEGKEEGGQLKTGNDLEGHIMARRDYNEMENQNTRLPHEETERLFPGEKYDMEEDFKDYRGPSHLPQPHYPSGPQPYHPYSHGPSREVTPPMTERPGEDIEPGILRTTRQPFSDHERYKLEKKRERNRIAATKCRMRKMERISQLDGQVAELQMENQRLGAEGHQLRQEVDRLRARLDQHLASGECRLAARQPDSTNI